VRLCTQLGVTRFVCQRLAAVRKKLAGARKSHRAQGGADVISANAYSGWKLVSFTLFGDRGPNLPFRDKCEQFCLFE
jgi:hypothetical protein